MSKDLPQGWTVARIGDVCRLVNGRAFKPGEWTSAGRPIIRIQNLNDPNASFNHFAGHLDPKHRVEHGDLLFAWSGTPGTSFGAHIWRGDEAALNQHIYRIMFSETQLDKRFLRLAINQRLDDLVHAAHGGAGLAHVTKPVFERTEISFPPLAEQRHIVARLEALLTQVSVSRERLTRVRDILKRFRQSVLAAACSGRLTEAWRAHHAPEALSADAVLAARRRAWIRAETTRRARDGRPIRDADLLKRYVAPAGPDGPGDAPDSWLWTTLDQITLLSGGLTKGLKRPARTKLSPVPYLRVANVQRGHLDLSVIKGIEATQAEIAELQLESGDILLNEGGDIDKLGRGWVWEGQIATCIHQNHVFRARPVAESINPYFVSHYANAVGQEFFLGAGAQTVNLASVSLNKVRSLPVPLPPPAEQAEIVRRVGTLFALADTIERRLTTAAVLSRSLSHAILAKAFQGGLAVPS